MHQHNWRSLYKIPADSHFLHTYNATGLSQWFICNCGVVGRGTEAIKPVPEKQQSTRKTDAKRWNQALQVWRNNSLEVSQ